MSSVFRSFIAAAAIVCGLAAAGTALAQDEGADTIRKKDGTTQQGKIESEDVTGLKVVISKASIGVRWSDVKSIDYAGGVDVRKAKSFLDGGQFNEAIAVLEDLRKKAELRPLLKAHVLNLLGAALLRGGDADKAIEVFGELFKTFPKTQFLTQGAGENLVGAYLAKGKPEDAGAALEQLSNEMKKQGLPQEPLNPLRGRVLEAQNNFSAASGAYNQMLTAATDDATKAAAELGIARCLVGQKKVGEAEAKYRAIVGRDGLPASVLAGAFNGLGQIAYDAGREKRDADLLTNALFHYLRGSVLYTPASGESTAEYERAIRGSADCFKALSEVEQNPERKKMNSQRAAERMSYLATKFPGSPYRQ